MLVENLSGGLCASVNVAVSGGRKMVPKKRIRDLPPFEEHPEFNNHSKQGFDANHQELEWIAVLVRPSGNERRQSIV